jgi:hypothetical protein
VALRFLKKSYFSQERGDKNSEQLFKMGQRKDTGLFQLNDIISGLPEMEELFSRMEAVSPIQSLIEHLSALGSTKVRLEVYRGGKAEKMVREAADWAREFHIPWPTTYISVGYEGNPIRRGGRFPPTGAGGRRIGLTEEMRRNVRFISCRRL